MDEAEARVMLDETLSRLRGLPYQELVSKHLDEVDAYSIEGKPGVQYQVEVQVFWDDPRKRDGDLRVMASIDDGRGWRSIAPLTDSFILAPDGRFVGE